MLSKDDQDRAIKKLDAELAKKTGDLNAFIFELTGRVKAVEDDVATDKEDLDLGASKETKDLEGTMRKGNAVDESKL